MHQTDSRKQDIVFFLFLVAHVISFINLKSLILSVFGATGSIIIFILVPCVAFGIYARSLPMYFTTKPHMFRWRNEADRKRPRNVEQRFESNCWWNEPLRWAASIFRYFFPIGSWKVLRSLARLNPPFWRKETKTHMITFRTAVKKAPRGVRRIICRYRKHPKVLNVQQILISLWLFSAKHRIFTGQ
jgi:hypothetical protein